MTRVFIYYRDYHAFQRGASPGRPLLTLKRNSAFRYRPHHPRELVVRTRAWPRLVTFCANGKRILRWAGCERLWPQIRRNVPRLKVRVKSAILSILFVISKRAERSAERSATFKSIESETESPSSAKGLQLFTHTYAKSRGKRITGRGGLKFFFLFFFFFFFYPTQHPMQRSR